MSDIRLDSGFEPAPSDASLDAVERVLAACLEREPDQRAPAFERACSTHPQIAPALRQRWSALAAMGLVELATPNAGEPDFPEQLGDFRLIDRLGGGGMGVVYRASQVSLGRDVALKLIRPEQLFFPHAKERFRREAEAVAKLSHPGVVPIHSVGEERGVPFFAMELVRGCTLAEALAQLAGRAPESLTGADLYAVVCNAAGVEPRTPPEPTFERGWVETCLALVRQVADALEHAHTRGLIHRDVKPSNIMITPDGRARLVDFGLTALTEASGVTKTGAQLGTLPYMAPEQVRGSKQIDARVDVYGLGVTLYELLSLQLPYRGDDALAVQRAILDGRFDSIRARNRGVAADVETVCTVAIERDPARRYASAGAFAHDLFNLLEHRPIAARPAGAALRLRRLAQRRPATATALVLGTLLIVGSLIALYIQQSKHIRELRATIEEQARESSFLLGLFTRASPSTPDKPLTVLDVISYGARNAEASFPDEPWLADRSLVFLGRLYHLQRLPADAVPLFEKALELSADPRAPYQYNHPNEIALYLAESLIALGQYDRAAELAERSRDFYRATYPDKLDRIHYAETLLALAWLGAGRVDEGTELTKRLLEATRAKAGVDSEDFARALCNLAQAHNARGDFARAEDLWKSALPTMRDKLGRAHADLVAVLSNIAVAIKKQGRLDDAAPFYEEALRMVREMWRTPNATVGGMLVNYASFEEARGHFDAAADLFREATEVLTTAIGPEAHATVLARGGLAGLLARHDHCDEAEELYVEVLPLQERALKQSDPIVGFSLSNLAKCALARGDRGAARDYLNRAIERWHACANSDEWIAGAEKRLAELAAN